MNTNRLHSCHKDLLSYQCKIFLSPYSKKNRCCGSFFMKAYVRIYVCFRELYGSLFRTPGLLQFFDLQCAGNSYRYLILILIYDLAG